MWKVKFNLNVPSPKEASTIVDGISVKVDYEGKHIELANIEAPSKEEARQLAIEAANHFLNTLAWKYDAPLAIDPSVEIVEKVEPGKRGQAYITIRERLTITDEVRVSKTNASGATETVYDSRKPGEIEVYHSEAVAYYRRAKLTSDPFDKFRNLFLAIENIMSSLRTKKTQRGEQLALVETLTEVFQGKHESLSRVAAQIRGFDQTANAFPEVARILYKANRCQLNHSKVLEERKIPFDPDDERQVKESLPLAEFVAKTFLNYEEKCLLQPPAV